MKVLFVEIVTDVVAIGIVAYGIYFRRYYRRDLAAGLLLAQRRGLRGDALLADSNAGVGLGLGLFGILSIIRLRSDSITQEEIAYYFVALALGLIAGLAAVRCGSARCCRPRSWSSCTSSTILGSPPAASGRSSPLDRAYPDRGQLEAALERLLGAEVRHLVVLQLDLVADTTMVDVRFKVPRVPRAPQAPLEEVAAAHPNGATA